jgi:membrane-associated phospholipid phosphatase
MKISAVVFLATITATGLASAQTTGPLGPPDKLSPLAATTLPAATPSAGGTQVDPQLLKPVNPSIFKSIGHDFTGFFSTDTAKVLGVFAVAGLAARPVDHAAVEDTNERMSKGSADVGNFGGGLLVQAGAGIAAYVVGRSTGNPGMASLGGDLIRAQVLTQTIVQGTKFVVGRERPDGSNGLSFPSGHTASAFATATVIQQHYGWKAGIPAFGFAGFVGASRMASNKHYLSDILVGAGIGIAAGRTVTFHLGREKFAMGATPTQGGAMVTFTKQ